jgi:hypothetical protein
MKLVPILESIFSGLQLLGQHKGWRARKVEAPSSGDNITARGISCQEFLKPERSRQII